jgi:hypothetical protein
VLQASCDLLKACHGVDNERGFFSFQLYIRLWFNAERRTGKKCKKRPAAHRNEFCCTATKTTATSPTTMSSVLENACAAGRLDKLKRLLG